MSISKNSIHYRKGEVSRPHYCTHYSRAPDARNLAQIFLLRRAQGLKNTPSPTSHTCVHPARDGGGATRGEVAAALRCLDGVESARDAVMPPCGHGRGAPPTESPVLTELRKLSEQGRKLSEQIEALSEQVKALNVKVDALQRC